MERRWPTCTLIALATSALAACAPEIDTADGAPEQRGAGEFTGATPPRIKDTARWDHMVSGDQPEPRFAGPPGACPGLPDIRVYVIVIDSLDPAEISPAMPRLRKLQKGGTHYEDARA